MELKFTLVDAVNVFGRFGLIKNMDKIDLGDIGDVLIVRQTLGNSYNVSIMSVTSSGKVNKKAFADCYLVTGKKIYRQQDYPGAEIMEQMNKFYRDYMSNTYPEYAIARKNRKLKLDEDAERFYGENHYSK